jgi:hypothetical protein
MLTLLKGGGSILSDCNRDVSDRLTLLPLSACTQMAGQPGKSQFSTCNTASYPVVPTLMVGQMAKPRAGHSAVAP